MRDLIVNQSYLNAYKQYIPFITPLHFFPFRLCPSYSGAILDFWLDAIYNHHSSRGTTTAGKRPYLSLILIKKSNTNSQNSCHGLSLMVCSFVVIPFQSWRTCLSYLVFLLFFPHKAPSDPCWSYLPQRKTALYAECSRHLFTHANIHFVHADMQLSWLSVYSVTYKVSPIDFFRNIEISTNIQSQEDTSIGKKNRLYLVTYIFLNIEFSTKSQIIEMFYFLVGFENWRTEYMNYVHTM